MCYSVKSSFETASVSLIAILLLLSSGLPYFQWIGTALIGWCAMQFAEMFLWMTEPRTKCTKENIFITTTIIPLVLISQPLMTLFGSFYVISWNKSSSFRKWFTILFSIFICALIGYHYYYKPHTSCSIVTKEGHLYWSRKKYRPLTTLQDYFVYFSWAFLIVLPFILFWRTHYLFLMAVLIFPLFGFLYGMKTDASGSIFCYYTSYASILSVLYLLFTKLF